jgi:hypothetical protein
MIYLLNCSNERVGTIENTEKLTGKSQRSMASIENKVEGLLTGNDYCKAEDVAVHPFYVHVIGLKRKSQRARWIYPLVYLVLGLVFVIVFCELGPMKTDQWQKLFGAVLGVYSALLAFWKPEVLLTQDDCAKRLGNKNKIPTADLQEINKLLSLPSKKADDILKLVGALASFAAIYLLVK